jgi:hypothetical protein
VQRVERDPGSAGDGALTGCGALIIGRLYDAGGTRIALKALRRSIY